MWTRAEALSALAARIGDDRCRAEPEAAARLVELCGFLPLAVAIVGAQLSAAPRMPLRLSVRELQETLPRLDALSADDRRVDVRAVFSWSYQSLTPRRHGPSAIWRFIPGRRCPPKPPPRSRASRWRRPGGICASLTSANLLSRDADGRYVVHDLVRAYGVELLEQEQDDRFGAETRLLDYLRHNAHAATQALYTRPKEELTDSPAPGVIRVAIADRTEAMDWFHQEEAAATAALRSMDDPRLLRHLMKLTHDWQHYFFVMGRWGPSRSRPAHRPRRGPRTGRPGRHCEK